MLLNLGIRAHDLAFNDLAGLIDQLHAYQLTHIQFAAAKCFPQNGPLTQVAAKHYHDTFAQAHIAITIQGCYVPLGAKDLAKRQAGIARFIHEAAFTKALGATVIATECGGDGNTPENFTQAAYERVRDSFTQILTALPATVPVAIEAGLHSPIYSAAVLRRLLDDLAAPNVCALVDGANLMTPDNWQRMPTVLAEALDLLAPDIAALHLKDARVVNGAVQIVASGHGVIDYTPWLTYIKQVRPQLPVSLEATKTPDITAAVAALQAKYAEL
ncbi:sugar phosphate isomerase/epimerase family protein [Lacticaseibacillus jixiensis]|uniref:sugar phosphate isomerase/epimerase family protein n=1 Tax=Lacticaseibacillus jixiensis TaxID=3231926 RepID=UPI0036F444C0